MSLFVVWDTEPPTEGDQVGTIRGWSDFVRWVDDLDEEEFGAVIQLGEHGASDQLENLERELSEVLESRPPEIPTVRSTVQRLLELLGDRPTDAEGAVVTDGTGKIFVTVLIIYRPTPLL